MNRNPSVAELFESGRYELAGELPHLQIKDFVIEQVNKRGRLIQVYFIYQSLMICLGILVLAICTAKAFQGYFGNLLYVAGALVFSFSALIVLHELLHGISFKMAGAPKVSYGCYLRKMIFYAEADGFVANKKQFTLVALFPLVFIQAITLAGAILFCLVPAMYFFLTIMSLHSLFCAGDIGLLAFFYHDNGRYFTFDDKPAKKSYYFREKNS